jgi:Uma2 family endonuclease
MLVLCDKTKLDSRSVAGAPDMVIEILSPGTARFDTLVKFRLYQRAGVREYWIVDPERQTVQVCVLDDKIGKYIVTAYGSGDIIPVHVLEGCQINMTDVFAEEDIHENENG